MKHSVLFVITFITSVTAAVEKPNIIFIIADDLVS